MLGSPPDCLCVVLVRAEGVEPPHLTILEPKSSASTSSATRARPLGGAPITGMRGWATRNPLKGPAFSDQRSFSMQQLPPIPEQPEPDTPEPSQPGQPTPAPPETPTHTPDIDVPSPSTPGTEPPSTPISPVG